jgi:hypothetical protein
MTCGGPHQHSCEEIFTAILLSIDNELVDPVLTGALETHCSECPPCDETLHAHQRNVALLKELLGAACKEEIPADLHQRLLEQTAELAAQLQAQEVNLQSFTQTFTQTYTETSITIDGRATIEISHFQEYREGF